MQLHFQERPWDLHAAVILMLASDFIRLAFAGADPIALVMVFLLPGYLLVAALFPASNATRSGGIDWIERMTLSFALSIALVPLVVLMLNFTPWGIQDTSIVVSITAVTSGLACYAYQRRLSLPPQRRLSLSITLTPSGLGGLGTLDKWVTAALGASVVVSSVTLAYVVFEPRPGETFTEFYILGPSGNASGYPTNLTVNESASVIIGIANHEGVRTNYTIRVDLLGVRLVYNLTGRFNETYTTNQTTWTWANTTIADGANWTDRYPFLAPARGTWKVEFLLYKDGDLSVAYRELHLFLEVQ